MRGSAVCVRLLNPAHAYSRRLCLVTALPAGRAAGGFGRNSRPPNAATTPSVDQPD